MNKVYVYYMRSCPYCKKLMKGLDKMGIIYEKINIGSSDGEARYIKLLEFTKNDNVPCVIVANQVLLPELAFNTMDEALILIKELYNKVK